MSAQQPSEEELHAALEQEMRRITVDDMLLQSVVSLVNLGGRRSGLAPGTEDEIDFDQVRLAIEAVQVLVPLIERGREPGQIAPIRDAVAQLQMAYARGVGGESPAGEQPGPAADPGAPADPGSAGGAGPAQSSGRLWVPGS